MCLRHVFFGVAGEMFAPEMRGMGACIGTTLTSLVTTLITVSFNGLVGAIHEAGVFWLFAAVCFAGVAYVTIFAYETKGKTLQEIQDHFRN